MRKLTLFFKSILFLLFFQNCLAQERSILKTNVEIETFLQKFKDTTNNSIFQRKIIQNNSDPTITYSRMSSHLPYTELQYIHIRIDSSIRETSSEGSPILILKLFLSERYRESDYYDLFKNPKDYCNDYDGFYYIGKVYYDKETDDFRLNIYPNLPTNICNNRMHFNDLDCVSLTRLNPDTTPEKLHFKSLTELVKIDESYSKNLITDNFKVRSKFRNPRLENDKNDFPCVFDSTEYGKNYNYYGRNYRNEYKVKEGPIKKNGFAVIANFTKEIKSFKIHDKTMNLELVVSKSSNTTNFNFDTNYEFQFLNNNKLFEDSTTQFANYTKNKANLRLKYSTLPDDEFITGKKRIFNNIVFSSSILNDSIDIAFNSLNPTQALKTLLSNQNYPQLDEGSQKDLEGLKNDLMNICDTINTISSNLITREKKLNSKLKIAIEGIESIVKSREFGNLEKYNPLFKNSLSTYNLYIKEENEKVVDYTAIINYFLQDTIEYSKSFGLIQEWLMDSKSQKDTLILKSEQDFNFAKSKLDSSEFEKLPLIVSQNENDRHAIYLSNLEMIKKQFDTTNVKSVSVDSFIKTVLDKLINIRNIKLDSMVSLDLKLEKSKNGVKVKDQKITPKVDLFISSLNKLIAKYKELEFWEDQSNLHQFESSKIGVDIKDIWNVSDEIYKLKSQVKEKEKEKENLLPKLQNAIDNVQSDISKHTKNVKNHEAIEKKINELIKVQKRINNNNELYFISIPQYLFEGFEKLSSDNKSLSSKLWYSFLQKSFYVRRSLPQKIANIDSSISFIKGRIAEVYEPYNSNKEEIKKYYKYSSKRLLNKNKFWFNLLPKKKWTNVMKNELDSLVESFQFQSIINVGFDGKGGEKKVQMDTPLNLNYNEEASKTSVNYFEIDAPSSNQYNLIEVNFESSDYYYLQINREFLKLLPQLNYYVNNRYRYNFQKIFNIPYNRLKRFYANNNNRE